MSTLIDPLDDGPMPQPLRADVAAARTASANLLPDGVGTRWRAIYTDSESPTGIAPVCTAESDGERHVIADYPGGPAPDPDGVYDCCPDPQIEIGSVPLAAYLVALLNADAAVAEEGDTPAAALPTTEWLLTPDTLAAIDDLIDRDGVFAKGYYERISDSTVITGLRIGSGPGRVVARFGDTIVRHADGTYSVRHAVVETGGAA
ncbi:hypothetical protein [Streptomyces buecherae]|uniref:hypothetical protein n=1 Tax=Streptomyces buecherae TaxID=2763006 RepID=UPI0037B37372